MTAWIVAYLARWLPHRSPTGLVPVGAPDEESPVLVTGNFTLTVRRVVRALAGRDLWLLVVNTDGINVWCAAAGGMLTAGRVVDAVRVSRLAERVRHRRILLPALAAPGVDRQAVRRETGFRCRFGPVYARDVPAYLETGWKKSDAMRRFDFGPRHRLDMFLPMNFPVYLLVAALLAVVAPSRLPGFTLLFWGAVAFLYAFLDWIPGRTGWGQFLLSAALFAGVRAVHDGIVLGNPLEHAGWLAATFLVFFAAGFDLAGTLSPRTSDAERMMQRLGFRRLGSLFVERGEGPVRLDRSACTGAMVCRDVCPVGVFGGRDAARKVTFANREACFACGACVRQCPRGALVLGSR